MNCELLRVHYYLERHMIMKKLLFALISSAAALSSVSMAHAEGLQGVYVGAGATANNYRYDVEGATSSDKNNGTKIGGKVFAGYNIDKNWAVEGGYQDFGNRDYNYTANGAPGTISTGSHAFYVAGKATQALNQQVSVFGKLGVARIHDGVSGSGVASINATDPSKTALYASVGASYAINQNVSLVTEVEHYGKAPEFGREKNAVAVSAVYNF